MLCLLSFLLKFSISYVILLSLFSIFVIFCLLLYFSSSTASSNYLILFLYFWMSVACFSYECSYSFLLRSCFFLSCSICVCIFSMMLCISSTFLCFSLNSSYCDCKFYRSSLLLFFSLSIFSYFLLSYRNSPYSFDIFDAFSSFYSIDISLTLFSLLYYCYRFEFLATV